MFDEVWFIDATENFCHCPLDHPVTDRRDAQWSQLSVGFGNVHAAHTCRPISTLLQVVVEGGDVRLEFLRELFHRYAVRTGRSVLVELHEAFRQELWRQQVCQRCESRACVLLGSCFDPQEFR